MKLIRFAIVVAALAVAPAVRADYKTMDYGPFLDATYQIKSPANNTVHRGTAIAFDVPAGKTLMSGQGGFIFDCELMRPAAWWSTGGFLKLDGVVFSGGHGANPSPAGKILLTTKPTPGWAKDGDWKDPRANAPYGPLRRDWAKFQGIYRYDDKAIFSYTVGDTAVLEFVEQEDDGAAKVLSRTLNLRASAKPLTLVVADFDGVKAAAQGERVAFDVMLGVEQKSTIPADPDKKTKEKTVYKTVPVVGFAAARVQGIEGAKLVLSPDGRLVAELPALKAPAKLKITVWAGDPERKAAGEAAVGNAAAPVDLAPFTKGGKARWTESFITAGTIGEPVAVDPKKTKGIQPQQAYVIDSITPPFKNAYESWFRIGGFDFFPDGRAAVCTWSGDVWIVSGIDDKLNKISWKRFASGLFQPLGLKIVDGVVYTLGRDGITKLHDFNNDGEADYYECFNNDFLVTSNFHEFIFDLQTDPEGNFYFIKGGPVRPGGSGWDKVVPHHGCIFKLSKDGTKLDVVARGFRAPNGMGVGPHGEITCGDNQGTWTPVCPINWVKPGGFYGVPDFAGKPKEEFPKVRDNPLCWLPYPNVDNSNGGQVWITGDKFGPLSGQMLHTSYGQSTLYLVMKEEVDGQMQGGVVPLLKFDSGVCRARFLPEKNELFLTGLRGWQTNASKDAGFYRVRYTGIPLNLPVGLNVKKGEIQITFSDALDTGSAGDAESYRLDESNVRWTQNYGSDSYKVSNPKTKGWDEVDIESVSVSSDGKKVTLKVPTLHPVMQMKITLNLKAADGSPIRTVISSTINVVGNQRGEVHVGEFRIIERKE